jgi:hypothetical protein
MLNCVGFIAYDREPTKYGGTVFFVSIKDQRNGMAFTYIVTAAHVA